MTRTVLRLLCVALVAVACTSSDGETVDAGGGADATTTSSTTGSTAPTTTTPDTTEGAGDEDPADETESVAEVEGALALDPAWEELTERWFVWGVADDDVLNVRSGPGMSNDILTTLPPDTTDIVRFSEVTAVGETAWTPIAIPGGAGWVALEFIKPTPSNSTPLIEGLPNVDDALLENVIAAIGDPDALAEFVGDDGLVVTPYQFVGPDAVNLDVDELRTSGAETRVWGERDGEGGPIEATLDDFMADLAGSTALTSTEQIGYGTILSSGNTINNVADAFPGTRVVEYYFAGTEYFGGLDWQSITLVFDDDDTLLAIVRGVWTI